MWCGEQVTNCHYFIQSSFILYSLHFELSRISLSIFGLFIILSIIASVFNHCPCPRIHSSLVISLCTFHNPEGFA